MTSADDKRAPLRRPAGYIPPPLPALGDVARTLAVIGTNIVPYLARLAWHRDLPRSGDAAGLATIRASFGRTLRRLGVELEVLHAERVLPTGGLVLMWNQESHLDHLVLPVAIPRGFVSLYNNEVARVPFYGAHMRRGGHVHVDRTNSYAAGRSGSCSRSRSPQEARRPSASRRLSRRRSARRRPDTGCEHGGPGLRAPRSAPSRSGPQPRTMSPHRSARAQVICWILVGAPADLEELGVARELLDAELAHVAVAAEDLDGLERALGGGAARSRPSWRTPRPRSS